MVQDLQAAIKKTLDPKIMPGGDAVRDRIYQNAHEIKKRASRTFNHTP